MTTTTKSETDNYFKACAELEIRIGKMRDGRFPDNLTFIVDMCLAYLHGETSDSDLELMAQVDGDILETTERIVELSKDYRDCFGNMFMVRAAQDRSNQVFTPEHIADLMAECVGEYSSGNVIWDSCCGSGRLVLRGVKAARRRGVEPVVYASDVDLLCCKITLLRMLLCGVSGVVAHADAITGRVLSEGWESYRVGNCNFWRKAYDKDNLIYPRHRDVGASAVERVGEQLSLF